MLHPPRGCCPVGSFTSCSISSTINRVPAYLVSALLTKMPAQQQGLSKFMGLALFYTVTALICTASSAVIITVSDNEIVETWKVQPTVLLAVLSSIFNVC